MAIASELRSKLKRVVEDSDTAAGRIFDISIQLLIILSITAFTVSTLPDLDETTVFYLHLFELLSVAIFTVEYCLRVYVSDARLRFIFSFYGLVDLIAIAPFYIGTGVDMRMVRAFRLLRIFKLFRYSKALQRFSKTFLMVRDELVIYGAASLIVLYLAASGIYLFENQVQPEAFKSVIHSLWWAVATLTTVGYGDVYPITAGGRIFTFIVLIVGLGVVAVPSGLIASAMTEVREQEND